MTRTEHTYQLGDATVALVVPEGIVAPGALKLRRATDAAVGTFSHVGSRTLRSPAKRKPRQASPLAPIPRDFAPPEDEIALARQWAPSANVEHETAQFVDWAIAKGEARADWLAAWRGWIRRTHARNLERGWKPAVASAPVGETPKQKWLREHGVTEAEYEQRKDDRVWVEMINRRGMVA